MYSYFKKSTCTSISFCTWIYLKESIILQDSNVSEKDEKVKSLFYRVTECKQDQVYRNPLITSSLEYYSQSLPFKLMSNFGKLMLSIQWFGEDQNLKLMNWEYALQCLHARPWRRSWRTERHLYCKCNGAMH